jgi:hypothetical protein
MDGAVRVRLLGLCCLQSCADAAGTGIKAYVRPMACWLSRRWCYRMTYSYCSWTLSWSHPFMVPHACDVKGSMLQGSAKQPASISKPSKKASKHPPAASKELPLSPGCRLRALLLDSLAPIYVDVALSLQRRHMDLLLERFKLLDWMEMLHTRSDYLLVCLASCLVLPSSPGSHSWAQQFLKNRSSVGSQQRKQLINEVRKPRIPRAGLGLTSQTRELASKHHRRRFQMHLLHSM